MIITIFLRVIISQFSLTFTHIKFCFTYVTACLKQLLIFYRLMSKAFSLVSVFSTTWPLRRLPTLLSPLQQDPLCYFFKNFSSLFIFLSLKSQLYPVLQSPVASFIFTVKLMCKGSTPIAYVQCETILQDLIF